MNLDIIIVKERKLFLFFLFFISLFLTVFCSSGLIDFSSNLTLYTDQSYAIPLETGNDKMLYVGFEISDGPEIFYYILKENQYENYTGGFAESYYYTRNVSETYSEAIELDEEQIYYLVLYNPQGQARSFTIFIVTGKYPAIGRDTYTFITRYLPIMISLSIIYLLIFIMFTLRERKKENEVLESFSEKRGAGQLNNIQLQTKEKQLEIAKQMKILQKKEYHFEKRTEEKKTKIQETPSEPRVILADKISDRDATIVYSDTQQRRRILPSSSVKQTTRKYKIIIITAFSIILFVAVIISAFAVENQLQYWFTAGIGIIGAFTLIMYRYRQYKKEIWKEVQKKLLNQYK